MVLDAGRIKHRADIAHRSIGSNGLAIPSNWRLSADGLKNVLWTPESASSVSYGSNSNDVSSVGAVGASTLVTRADHVHRGVRTVTSNGSNGLFGDVNLVAGTGIGLGVTGQNLTITNLIPAGSGGGGGSTGLAHSYVGYNVAGGTFTTVTGNRYYCKKVTLAATSVFTSVDVYVRGVSDAVTAMGIAVLSDLAGSPDILQAGAIIPSSFLYLSNSASMPTAARWLSYPIGIKLAAGDYWLCVTFNNGNVALANDASGTDVTFTASSFLITGAYPTAWALTVGAVKYSIRAGILA